MQIGFIGPLLGLTAAVAVLAVFAYWQLVVAEGAYLGQRVVTYLYDRFAPRYDTVKQFNLASDALRLAAPVLAHNPAARVLDLATGTGRLPLALLLQPTFSGSITAIDSSAKMLAVARTKLADHAARVTLLQHDVSTLPFPAAQFDVVTCLEALEFFPQPARVLGEMLRVLAPGGLLVISNRIGPDAWKLPGRTLPSAQLAAQLRDLGATDICVDEWLLDYDLITAHRAR
jgi:ubiquinone/menaquinone biosynthesis C-methylase UbiE